VVELCLSYDQTVKLPRPRDRFNKCERIGMVGPPPALMYVCRESRKLALEKYSCAFTDDKDTSNFEGIRIDPIEDTIYIPYYERLDDLRIHPLLQAGLWPGAASTCVQSLVIDAMMWPESSDSRFGIPIWWGCKNLKRFTVAIRQFNKLYPYNNYVPFCRGMRAYNGIADFVQPGSWVKGKFIDDLVLKVERGMNDILLERTIDCPLPKIKIKALKRGGKRV